MTLLLCGLCCFYNVYITAFKLAMKFIYFLYILLNVRFFLEHSHFIYGEVRLRDSLNSVNVLHDFYPFKLFSSNHYY